MQGNYNDNVLDYWKFSNGNFNEKMKKDDGLDGDNDIRNTVSSHF